MFLVHSDNNIISTLAFQASETLMRFANELPFLYAFFKKIRFMAWGCSTVRKLYLRHLHDILW